MEQTSSSLIRGISDFEDHQRWFEFNHLYRPMIRKVLQKKGLRSDELDDAVQDVYVSLLSTIDRFRYDRRKGKFRSWVSKIAQRAASAHHRRAERDTVDPQRLEDAQLDLSPRGDERLQLCLKMARGRFDDQTWLAFYLRVMEEAPIEEVQRITGMNRNAIYQAVHRVKQCLREMLTQLNRE